MSEAIARIGATNNNPEVTTLPETNVSAFSSMRGWIMDQLLQQGFSWEPYIKSGITKITEDNPEKFGPMASRMLLGTANIQEMEPSTATWLGGVCSLSTGD